MPWQQYAADVALELDPATGDLYYDEVVITVPRQSGKTTLLLAVMVWRCVMFARRLDDRQIVTYLAQMGKSARKKLEREFIPALRRSLGFKEVAHSRARPVKPTDFKSSMNNGSEHILFGTQSYLQVEAPGETSSHGDVLDMSVIDEAFAHETDLVEQAVDAANITRKSAQTWVISTAGNKRSRFLWLKVLAGRWAHKSGKHGRTCYLEWGVPMDVAYDDEANWWKHLPALGHTITVEKLRARLEKAKRNPDLVDDEDMEPGVPGFRRGYLNQWMETPDLGGGDFTSEISPEVWMAPVRSDGTGLVDPGSKIVGALVVGVGVSKDGLSASVVVAGKRADGLAHVETLERASGVWWVERYVRGAVEDHAALFVAWDHGGPERTIAPDLTRAAGGKDRARPLNGREWAGACEAFKLAVMESRIRHLGDVLLQDAVSGAVKREVGEGWVWDSNASRSDITPLRAATAALRALELLPEEQPFESFAIVL